MMKCVLEGKHFVINPKYAAKCNSVPNKIVLITNTDDIITRGRESGLDDRVCSEAFAERYYWRFKPTEKHEAASAAAPSGAHSPGTYHSINNKYIPMPHMWQAPHGAIMSYIPSDKTSLR